MPSDILFQTTIIFLLSSSQFFFFKLELILKANKKENLSQQTKSTRFFSALLLLSESSFTFFCWKFQLLFMLRSKEAMPQLKATPTCPFFKKRPFHQNSNFFLFHFLSSNVNKIKKETNKQSNKISRSFKHLLLCSLLRKSIFNFPQPKKKVQRNESEMKHIQTPLLFKLSSFQ